MIYIYHRFNGATPGGFEDRRLTTVKLELVVKIVKFLLDFGRTRTVLTRTEGQEHVNLEVGRINQSHHKS